MKSDLKVREPAVWDRRPRSEDGTRRILVVANETVAGPRAPRRDRLARQAGRPRPRRLPGTQLSDPPLGLRRGSRARRGAEASRRFSRRAGAVGSCSSRRGGRRRSDSGDRGRATYVGADETAISTHPPGARTGSRRVWSDGRASASTFRSAHVVVDLEHEREHVAHINQEETYGAVVVSPVVSVASVVAVAAGGRRLPRRRRRRRRRPGPRRGPTASAARRGRSGRASRGRACSGRSLLARARVRVIEVRARRRGRGGVLERVARPALLDEEALADRRVGALEPWMPPRRHTRTRRGRSRQRRR